MKITFKNNSSSGISRAYPGFRLDIPGNAQITADVPHQYVADALAYLKKNRPAVEIGMKSPTEPPEPHDETPETPADESAEGVPEPKSGDPDDIPEKVVEEPAPAKKPNQRGGKRR